MNKLALLCLLLAPACITGQGGALIDTPSGKPEVTIDAKPDRVGAELLNGCLDAGWTLRDQTPNQLTFWREDPSLAGIVFMGSEYDATPTAEIRFVLAETRDMKKTRVLAHLYYLTNEGSAFERRSDMNDVRSMESMQANLEEIKRRVEQGG